ncbi:unnamed protein product [Ostreobium quekettii]|uniref:Uncharacterized protein n=1 Tax=Ostreobium quekettii TaxID=121088 RepID=A0A8S1IJY4_9CHLO|nr:unnamed protein product [Ostreobium quekettii]|eukprot:evm.model.scf_200EXC.1 EVM.evm.TU.scf_200EXC.1   scf_200EXC:6625-8904(+)
MTAEVFETAAGVTNRSVAHEMRRTGKSPGAVRASDPPFGATASQVADNWSGEGKVVIVTGGYGGIGLETARVLASRGAEVVIAGRNESKGEDAIAELRKENPEARLRFMRLDTSSLASVAAFVESFRKSGLEFVNTLVNNAGIMHGPFGLSKDGHEMQFATNHLGHFLLTRLLAPELEAGAKRAGAASRVVNVSSCMHHATYPGGVRFEGLDEEKGYSEGAAYGQSKLANILFTRELEARMRSSGAQVTGVCCHPGVVPTQIMRSHSKLVGVAFRWIFKNFMPCYREIPQGAATQVFLCTADEVKGGEYYMDFAILPTSRYAVDRTLAKKLWDVSEDMCQEYLKG